MSGKSRLYRHGPGLGRPERQGHGEGGRNLDGSGQEALRSQLRFSKIPSARFFTTSSPGKQRPFMAT